MEGFRRLLSPRATRDHTSGNVACSGGGGGGAAISRHLRHAGLRASGEVAAGITLDRIVSLPVLDAVLGAALGPQRPLVTGSSRRAVLGVSSPVKIVDGYGGRGGLSAPEVFPGAGA